MSYEERNALAGLISTLIVSLLFGMQLWQDYLSGEFIGPDGLKTWAQTIVWMVPTSIIICITTIIAVNVIYSIVTSSPNLNSVADERDAAIGKRGMQVTLVVVSIGFVAAIIILSTGGSALTGLTIILAGFVAGDMSGNLAKLAAYRFGY
jgi:hypothetical protein